MSILQTYLSKLNVKSYLDLNDEERATYRSWENALAGRRITDDDVSAFLDTELQDTIGKLPGQRLGSKDDTFLKVKLEFLLKVRSFLDAPEMERKAVEASIERSMSSITG